MAALARNLESYVVRGVALDLNGRGRKVVEVLVEQLEAEGKTVSWVRPSTEGSERAATFPGAAPRPLGGRMAYVVGRLANVSEGWNRHLEGEVVVSWGDGEKTKTILLGRCFGALRSRSSLRTEVRRPSGNLWQK